MRARNAACVVALFLGTVPAAYAADDESTLTIADQFDVTDGRTIQFAGGLSHHHGVYLEGGYIATLAVESDVDTLLVVRDQDGNVVAEDDNGGGGFNPRVEFVPAAAGVYTVVVTTHNPGRFGTYELTVARSGPVVDVAPLDGGVARSDDAVSASDDDADVAVTAPALRMGSLTLGGGEVESELGPGDAQSRFGQHEAWDVEIPPQSVVTVDMRARADREHSVRVFSPDGRVLAIGSPWLDPTSARVSFATAQGGTFRVVVTGRDVTYGIAAVPEFSREPLPEVPPIELTLGQEQVVAAEPGDLLDDVLPAAWFQTSEWSTVALEVRGEDLADYLLFFAVESEALPEPIGLLTASEFWSESDRSGVTAVFDLPPGRHALLAQPGDYSFSVIVRLVDDVWGQGAPVARGATVAGALLPGRVDGYAAQPVNVGDVQCHPLVVETPGRFVVSVEGVGFEPLLTVLNDLGQSVSSSEADAAGRHYLAERAGQWRVCISGQDGGAGAYSVSVH